MKILVFCVFYLLPVVESIIGYLGESVTLPLGADPSFSSVRWFIMANETWIATTDGKTKNTEHFWRYRGRLDLNMSSGDLVIKNLTKEDANLYTGEARYQGMTRKHATKVELQVKYRLANPSTEVFSMLRNGRCITFFNCSSPDVGVGYSWSTESPPSKWSLDSMPVCSNDSAILLASIEQNSEVNFTCTVSSTVEQASSSVVAACHDSDTKPPHPHPRSNFGFGLGLGLFLGVFLTVILHILHVNISRAKTDDAINSDNLQDLYTVPTWKNMAQSDILQNMPADMDMMQLIVFPAWTNASGPDHYILCVMRPLLREILFLDSHYYNHESGFGDSEYRDIFRGIAQQIDQGKWTEKTGFDIPGLPRQMSGNDCGIFMLMYTHSLVKSVPFEFQEMDMLMIREWWCVRLMERFETEGQGKRFAHWTSQATSLLTGMLPPVYRVPKSSRLTKDVPQHIQAAQERKNAAEKILLVIKTGRTEKRLKAVLTGEEPSKWLERFLGDSKFKAPVYFEEDEHMDVLWSYLSTIMDTTPPDYPVRDRIEFIFSVLCPEAMTSAIAEVQGVTAEEAEQIFMNGPGIHKSEVIFFEDRVKRQRKQEGYQPLRKRPKF